ARVRPLSSPAGAAGAQRYGQFGKYGQSTRNGPASHTSQTAHTSHTCRPRGLIAALGLAVALATAAFGGESRTERMIGPRVKHVSIYRTDGPWAVQVVEAGTSDPYVHLGTALPGRGLLGLQRTGAAAERLRRDDDYVIAGVDGG